MPPNAAVHRAVPTNPDLLDLIRAKREHHWKPSIAELKQGFRGWHQRGYLPHFDAPGVTQFVTFHLHDSFPVTRNAEFETIVSGKDESEKRKQIEQWLDRGHGNCWLRERSIAQVVETTLRSRDRTEYQLHAWTIMPNHVHLVVDIWDVPLANLINNWKGSSACQTNSLLTRRGAFWQADYFDTLIRNADHLKRAVRYTEQNPVKALMVQSACEWPWSSARLRDEYERL